MTERLRILHLTRVEWEHILTAVVDQWDRGEFWGRRDQFNKRVERIIAKLEAAQPEAEAR